MHFYMLLQVLVANLVLWTRLASCSNLNSPPNGRPHADWRLRYRLAPTRPVVTTSVASQLVGPFRQPPKIRPNKLDELFNEVRLDDEQQPPSSVGGAIAHLQKQQQQSDNYAHQVPPKSDLNGPAAHLSNSGGSGDGTTSEEPETFINNHQQVVDQLQNSRTNFNGHQTGANLILASSQKYGRFVPTNPYQSANKLLLGHKPVAHHLPYYSAGSASLAALGGNVQNRRQQVALGFEPPAGGGDLQASAAAAAAAEDLASICGRQQANHREPRVVGGNSTYEGEFPWAVSIQRHGNHHCGGVIVGRRWILTAAHCVRSQLVSNLLVRTGGLTLTRSANSINSHLERDFQVEQIIMHDDFSRYDNLTASQLKSSANTNNADIALLKLRQEITWNELARPVCFPNKEAGNFSGHEATVIGWGKLNEKSEEFSNELQKVKLVIIDNKLCQTWFRQAGREMPIDERIICAGFKSGGKDACHGDSGGPLLSRINGQYAVVGVVSTGIGCARPLLPGLYSRVTSYIGWIEQYVAS